VDFVNKPIAITKERLIVIENIINEKTTAIKNSLLTSVSSLVNLQVLTAGKNFSAAGKRTRKRPLPGVHSDVVDQFVLGLERLKGATASLPETSVVALLRASNVFHRDVRHDLVHGRKYLPARLDCELPDRNAAASGSRMHRVGIEPQAG